MIEMAEECLYDPELLQALFLSEEGFVLKEPFTLQNPGPNLVLRPLKTTDFEKDYLQILSQLSVVGNITRKQYLDRFYSMKSCPSSYYVSVIEDEEKGKIIGSATLHVEFKFIHHCAKRARLEDVVVSDEYRGMKLGKLLATTVCALARRIGCYKISLDCKDHMIPFYESIGFLKEQKAGNFLSIRYPQNEPTSNL